MTWLVLVLSLVVAALFAGSGLVEAFRWRSASSQFVAWGYPPYWPLVTSAVKIVTGGLILGPETRLIGLSLCALVGCAAVLTVFRTRTHQLYIPASIVTCLTVITTVLAWSASVG